MGDENPIRTLGDYTKPSHEGYRNTNELPVGNNVVPLRSDTIWLVQNGCLFHRLRSKDPNQHLKDFLKLVDSLDLDGENRERTRLRLFQFSLRNQVSNWLECLPAGSITTWEDLTTRFLAQFFPPGRTTKLPNNILIRTIDQSAGGKLRDRNAEESWALLEDLAHYDNKCWNDPRDFSKPVKAISLPQDVQSTSDRHLIELENQVQRLMKAYIALTQPTQVNKVTTSCEICSGPYDTQYCMEDPKQAFVKYASSHADEAGGKWYTFKPEQNIFGDTYNPSWRSHPNLSFNNQSNLEGLVSNFMASQDAGLSKFEADFKQQQDMLGIDLEPDEWIKDSRCSKHMTCNRKLFSTYKAYNGGNVIFGCNLRSNIIGKGQICDNKCRVTFSEYDSEIIKDGKVIGRGIRKKRIDNEGNLEEFCKANAYYTNFLALSTPSIKWRGRKEKNRLQEMSRLESIRILLAYAYALDFKLFQMDVKSAFMNGFINEEVYMAQPSGFIDFEKPNHVYKLKKALYGLKQAPKACSTCQDMCDEFAKIMHDEFEMSMMGELNFFLGLQIKQIEDGIFFNQSKYFKEMPKKFGLEDSKPMKTPISSDTKLTKDEECELVDSTKYRGMIEAPKTSHLEAVKHIFQYIKGTTHLGLWYPKGTGKETVVYADSDYVVRKITSGGHKDHVSACLCHMLYCIETSTRYNLAFFVLKRMEKTRSKPKELLPYGMLLTRLFKHVVSVFPELAIDRYISHDRVMHPLAPHYERKTRSDRGKKRPRESNASSSSTTLNHPSSSHPLDDPIDENDDESFHSNPSSPSQNISSSSNDVSRVHQNPPHESHYLNTHLSETINLQTQQRDAHREGLRSIGQALKNMMGGKRK
ncbi:MAK10-like protein [Tanacetum coccineum]